MKAIDLSDRILSELSDQFIGVKLLVIEEYSMVGSKMLYVIDSHLKRTFSTSVPFGGISV